MLVQELLLDGIPVSLQIVAIGLVVSLVVYSVKLYRKDGPVPGIPLITLDGQSPKDTWMLSGNRAITEGLRRVCYTHQTSGSLLCTCLIAIRI